MLILKLEDGLLNLFISQQIWLSHLQRLILQIVIGQ